MEYVVSGSVERKPYPQWNPPGAERSAVIWKRLQQSLWHKIRKHLEKEHRITISGDYKGNTATAELPTETLKSSTSKGKGRIPAKFQAPLIKWDTDEPGIFANTLDRARHPLSDSTLVDNCGACHLVNSKDLLEPGTFVTARSDECVEAGTSRLPILGYGTRIFPKSLKVEDGDALDLELKNVAVVSGFYTNIISESLLRKSELWVNGWDLTLRYGGEDNGLIVRQLERKQGLTFFEYKPLYYSAASNTVIQNYTSDSIDCSYAIMMYPTLKRELRRIYKGPREYLYPRIDIIDL